MNRLIIGLIIFVSIFGFTSLMDGYKWSKNFEIFRSIFITTILIFDFNSFYNHHNTFTTFIILYSIFNILLIFPNKSYLPKRKKLNLARRKTEYLIIGPFYPFRGGISETNHLLFRSLKKKEE